MWKLIFFMLCKAKFGREMDTFKRQIILLGKKSLNLYTAFTSFVI